MMDDLLHSHLNRVVDAARKLRELSTQGFELCGDDGCLMLSGFLRECSYKLEQDAHRELRVHQELGLVGSGFSEGPEADTGAPGHIPPPINGSEREKGG